MEVPRLRKVFQYDTDGVNNDEPEVMDEQEQEEYIAKLKVENDERNELYMKICLALPCTSWMIFVLGMIRARHASARLVCILGITSLWATAYNLFFVPTKPASASSFEVIEKKRPFQIQVTDKLSPAQQYVPILNGALSVLIALWGLSFRNGRGVVEGFSIFCFVPLVEYIMIQMARKWIVEVDPLELEKLRYEFRGA